MASPPSQLGRASYFRSERFPLSVFSPIVLFKRVPHSRYVSSGEGNPMPARRKSVRWSSMILAVGVVLVSGGRCLAARYVPIPISVNGRAILKGGTGDNGAADP